MTQRSTRGLATVALLTAFALAASCSRSSDDADLDQQQTAVTDAPQEITLDAARSLLGAKFTPESLPTCDASISAAFRTLLATERGREEVRSLARRHHAVVFDEEGDSVYYAHIRSSEPRKSCLGAVIMHDKSHPTISHSGFPSHVLLTSLDIHENTLLLRGVASADQPALLVVGSPGLEPGGTYEAAIELAGPPRKAIGLQAVRDTSWRRR